MRFIPHISNLKKQSKKRVILTSPKGRSFCMKKIDIPEKRDFGPTGLTYTTCELLTIDENFKYYNQELTGDPKIDLQLIYGSKDVHDSIGILTRPTEDNIAKIKRNYDISLSLCDGIYIINNGRHRLVYLRQYYDNCVEYCDTEEALQQLKETVTIPVRVIKRIEDPLINEIIIYLKNKYEDIVLIKANVLNDEPEIIVMLNKSIYYLKNKEEIIDFYCKTEEQADLSNHKLIDTKETTYFDVNRIFEVLYTSLGKELFNMSYVALIKYLKLNSIVIDGVVINVENIALKRLYMKYLDMTTCYMICQTYDVDLPDSTSFEYKTYSKEHKIGLYLMHIINQHLEYTDLTWDQIFTILHEDPKLKQYDSDYLKDIAIEHGIRLVLGEHIFVHKKKTK